MKRLTIITITTMIVSLFLTATITAEDFKVKPGQYRGWHHVKSMVIFDEKHPLYNPFNGIHHVYINKTGLEEIKKIGKRKFKDGTVLAIVFYEHKLDNGAYTEGAKKLEAFMVKDSKKYNSTNGWGYYAYDGQGNNIVKDMINDCHSCHGQVKENDYVFSTWTK